MISYARIVQVLHNGEDFCMRHAFKITAAFGSRSALSPSEKIYHEMKLAGLGVIFIASACSLNLEGIIGGSFALGDEITRLEEIGEPALKLACAESASQESHPAPMAVGTAGGIVLKL